jgi:uncharacterized damage-inducible protein DinB
MSCSYHSDLASWEERIRVARDELLGVIDPLGRADLERARKGGWTVQKVLEHVIHSERLYGQATAYLVGAEVRADDGSSTPGSATEARTMLLDGRKALLKALESLDEDPMAYETFYDLKKVGHEEYSVISVLENVANHDREHAEQIRTILASNA